MSMFSKNEGEAVPDGASIHSAGAKADVGKAQMSLLGQFGLALTEVGYVGTGGAIKYTRDGWITVDDGINRYTDAMLRHYFKEPYETNDPQHSEIVGRPIKHAAQVAWNALARLELMLRQELSEETAAPKLNS